MGKPTVSVGKATRIAADYFEGISPEKVKLSVEEIELDEASDEWNVTLGISDQFGFSPKNKEYKIFKIDADTGEVKSMKIRTI